MKEKKEIKVELRTRVEVFQVEMECPVCASIPWRGRQTMQKVVGSWSVRGGVKGTAFSYQHKCTKCSYLAEYDVQYPYYEYKPIDQ